MTEKQAAKVLRSICTTYADCLATTIPGTPEYRTYTNDMEALFVAIKALDSREEKNHDPSGKQTVHRGVN